MYDEKIADLRKKVDASGWKRIERPEEEYVLDLGNNIAATIARDGSRYIAAVLGHALISRFEDLASSKRTIERRVQDDLMLALAKLPLSTTRQPEKIAGRFEHMRCLCPNCKGHRL